MTNQNLPDTAEPAFSAVRSAVHDYSAFARREAERSGVLDLLKVVLIAVAPPIIMFLGAVAAVDATHELADTVAKIEEPIDEAVRKELMGKLLRFLWIWPLIPALQLCVAAFAHIAGSVRSERAEGVAALAYIAGFSASLAAYTLYEPYFALFTEFWRRLTEFTYLGSVLVIYLNAYRRLAYKKDDKIWL